jgi:hypothetical protein
MRVRTAIPILVLVVPVLLLLALWLLLTVGEPWIRPFVHQLAGQETASEATRAEVLAALADHDRLDILAHRQSDGTLLYPRATGAWLIRREANLASLRARGWHLEIELLDRQIKDVYTLGDRVVVEEIDTWRGTTFDQSGQVVVEPRRTTTSQAVFFVFADGAWKITDLVTENDWGHR